MPDPAESPKTWTRFVALAVSCEQVKHLQSSNVTLYQDLTTAMLGLHGPDSCLKALEKLIMKPDSGEYIMQTVSATLSSLDVKPLTLATVYSDRGRPAMPGGANSVCFMSYLLAAGSRCMPDVGSV